MSTAPAVPDDPSALRPVTVKIVGERAAAAAEAAAAAAEAAAAGAAAAPRPENDNGAPDVRSVTIMAAPSFSKSQIKAAVEAVGGPPARHQRLLLSNVDALSVVDRRCCGGLGGGSGLGLGGGVGGGKRTAAAAALAPAGGGACLGVAPCGVASSASLALSGHTAVVAPTAKKQQG